MQGTTESLNIEKKLITRYSSADKYFLKIGWKSVMGFVCKLPTNCVPTTTSEHEGYDYKAQSLWAGIREIQKKYESTLRNQNVVNLH